MRGVIYSRCRLHRLICVSVKKKNGRMETKLKDETSYSMEGSPQLKMLSPSQCADLVQCMNINLATQHLKNFIVPYAGDTEKIDTWLEQVEKFVLVQRGDEDRKLGILLQTSTGAVSDFVLRHVQANSQVTYKQLKQLLLGSYGPALDEQRALKRLFGIKQNEGEHMQILVERF